MSCVTSVPVCCLCPDLSRELLLYPGLAGGSSLTGQVVAVLSVQTTLFVAAFLPQSLLKKNKFQNPLQFIGGNLALWVCCSLACGSLLSLFLLGLLHSYCLHVLDVPLLPGWKCVGSGPWVCAAVAVPADAAPGHCPSGSSIELIPGYLSLENSRLDLPGPCPAMSILCIS